MNTVTMNDEMFDEGGNYIGNIDTYKINGDLVIDVSHRTIHFRKSLVINGSLLSKSRTNIYCGSISVKGNVIIDGDLKSNWIISVDGFINANGIVFAEHRIMANEIDSTGDVISEGGIIVNKNITTKGGIDSNEYLVVGNDIKTIGHIRVKDEFICGGKVI